MASSLLRVIDYYFAWMNASWSSFQGLIHEFSTTELGYLESQKMVSYVVGLGLWVLSDAVGVYPMFGYVVQVVRRYEDLLFYRCVGR